MYPVSAVLHAVSMRPSRPPIAWKKNSWGVRPLRYEFSTKPRDSGPRSSLQVRQRAVLEPVRDALTFDILLSDDAHDLRDIDIGAL